MKSKILLALFVVFNLSLIYVNYITLAFCIRSAIDIAHLTYMINFVIIYCFLALFNFILCFVSIGLFMYVITKCLSKKESKTKRRRRK